MKNQRPTDHPFQAHLWATIIIQALVTSGCDPNLGSSQQPIEDSGAPELEPPSAAEPETSVRCSDRINLEILPLDIWGQDLPSADLTLAAGPSPIADHASSAGIVIPLGIEPASLTVSISADGHTSAQLAIDHDGGEGIFAISAGIPTGKARVARAMSTRDMGAAGQRCPIVTVFVGLDHQWFSSAAAPPSLNRADLRMDGEALWGDVYDSIVGAEQRITWSTWIWESDFELSRPSGHIDSTQAERQRRTSLGALTSKPAVARRILVNDFAQGLDGAEYISIDGDLREWAEATDDNFEVMLQANPVQLEVDGNYDGEPAGFSFSHRVLANPRYAKWDVLIEEPTALLDATVAGGSYHQKALVVDGQVAFVSGMNVKGADWDDSEHQVFNLRRMAIDASRSDRLDVEAAEMLPDYGPRKDFGIRVEGPAARDVEAILHRRWNLGLDGGDLYAEHASTWNLDPAHEVSGETVLTQVVATLPPPFHDMSILEAHEKAIRNAEAYIYIEDQYFRAPRVLDAIVEQMLAVPDLVLIVVTKPVADWDPGAKYSYISDSRLRDLFPERYLLLQLQTFDVVLDEGWFYDELVFYFEPIDTHSKLRLVDDKYLSVGSCNFNNRGYLYEGEMNIEVLDHGFAADARRDIFSNLVGPDWAHLVSGDAAANLELLATVAASNQAHRNWWEENLDLVDSDAMETALDIHSPSGFVYPLEFSYAYWWDVGPDLF